MTNEQLYTSLEDSKLIAPIMKRLGVEADRYYQEHEGTWLLVNSPGPGFAAPNDWTQPDYCPCYRLDRLLLVLPEWCSFSGLVYYESKYVGNLIILRGALQHKRGKEALHAACELILLLNKEELL